MMVGNKEEDVSILTHPLLYYFSKNHIFGCKYKQKITFSAQKICKKSHFYLIIGDDIFGKDGGKIVFRGK